MSRLPETHDSFVDESLPVSDARDQPAAVRPDRPDTWTSPSTATLCALVGRSERIIDAAPARSADRA